MKTDDLAMKTQRLSNTSNPVILSSKDEAILRAVYDLHFVTAQEITQLLFSKGSLTYVRGILSRLSGGEDHKTHHYLYRFQIPSGLGNRERVYSLGAKGHDFLASELGLPVDGWYFRPHKLRHLSYSKVLHDLLLARLIVAAHVSVANQSDLKLSQVRTCYELSRLPAPAETTNTGRTEKLKVIPDAYVLFERLRNGLHERFMPLWIEVDRGTEQGRRFREHLSSRIAFIQSGGYRELFHTNAVLISYVTTGDRPAYQTSRLKAMCRWTQQVLSDLHLESWASIFRFTSLQFDDLYSTPIFSAPLWQRPDSHTPVLLFED